MIGSHAMVLLISLPLVASIGAFVAPRAGRLFGLGAAGLILVFCGLAGTDIYRFGASGYPIGGWLRPLGIELYADGLGLTFIGMTAVVGSLISVYAAAYFRQSGRQQEEQPFWILWLMLWAAMNLIYLTGDLFNLYVGIELLGLSAVSLVALAGGKALQAAMRYLLVSLLGSLAYLFGVALLYAKYGRLDLAGLASLLESGNLTLIAFSLMMAGLFIKTALFPMHFWLPPAHANARGPVSAILSALVVKASFYIILRLWTGLYSQALAPSIADVFGYLGMAAILWGSLQALRQERLKMMVAYSTVAQLGYLFLIFPLAAAQPGNSTAWLGGVLFAVSHGCAKAAMFLAAGTVKRMLEHDRIRDLNGVGLHLPGTMFAFGIAGISLIGLPPSGGFLGKWLMLSSAIETGNWVYAIVIVIGSLLAAAYVLPVFARALALEAGVPLGRLCVPGAIEWAPFVLAILSLGLGLVATEPLRFLEIGGPFSPPAYPGGQP